MMGAEVDLVSVVVVTYNSAGTIEEMLDSIAAQTYPAVEIVVSDDCGPDDTLAVTEAWSKRHPEIPVVIVPSLVNTGISGNINRGVRASHGKWLKLIAGDDMLVPHAIERYMQYCHDQKVEVCVSKLAFFGDNTLIAERSPVFDIFFDYYVSKSFRQRKKIILRENTIPMPGLFTSRGLYDELGGIDEAYPFGEEWPFYVKILECNYDLPMFADRLVRYRCVPHTLSAKRGSMLDKRVFRDQKLFYKQKRRSKMLREKMYGEVFLQDMHYYITGLKYRSENRVVRTILTYMNPASYINRIRLILRK